MRLPRQRLLCRAWSANCAANGIEVGAAKRESVVIEMSGIFDNAKTRVHPPGKCGVDWELILYFGNGERGASRFLQPAETRCGRG